MCLQGQETLDLEPKCRSSLRPSGEQGFCSPWIYLLLRLAGIRGDIYEGEHFSCQKDAVAPQHTPPLSCSSSNTSLLLWLQHPTSLFIYLFFIPLL